MSYRKDHCTPVTDTAEFCAPKGQEIDSSRKQWLPAASQDKATPVES